MSVNSVTAPAGVMRAMPPDSSVNQRLPSGPAVMEKGALEGAIPCANSVTLAASATPPLPSDAAATATTAATMRDLMGATLADSACSTATNRLHCVGWE